MLILGSLLWRTTGGGFVPPIPPPVVPDDTRPSGGIPAAFHSQHGPTPEQTRRSRIAVGLVAEVIEQVAERQAADFRLDDEQKAQELRAEMRLRGLEMEAQDLRALNDRREQVILAETAALMARQQAEYQIQVDNRNALILLMLASA